MKIWTDVFTCPFSYALSFRLMQNSLEGEVIRTQELSHIIATVSQSLPGYLLAWDFVKENWEKLTRK